MHIKIKKSILLEGLNISSKAISNKSSLEILSGLLLKVKDNQITIIGNDLNLGIKTTIDDVEVFEEGSIVVDSSFFINIINKLPNDLLDIKYNKNKVHIKCNDIKFDIVATSSEEYPILPNIEKENNYKINPKLMKNMIKQTIIAISTDEARPILNGVLFKIENSELTLVALDGYRLAHTKAKIEELLPNEVVIPGKTLRELSKILSDNSELNISFTKNHILFNVDNVVIISRLLEGNFINYDKIIPETFKSEMIINRDKLIYSLERGILLAMKNNKSSIKFVLSNYTLKIESNAESGMLDEKIDIDYKGEDLIIGFNPNYIIDVLKVIDSEKVIMTFNNNISPSIIKGLDNENYKYMILPVRLS